MQLKQKRTLPAGAVVPVPRERSVEVGDYLRNQLGIPVVRARRYQA